MSTTRLALILLGSLSFATVASAADSEPYRLVFLQKNFMDAKQADAAIAVIEQAAKSGYTGIALNDAKFPRWFEIVTVHRPEYDKNVQRVRQACRDHHLKCYVFACEATTDMLSNDPSLAEGMPVVDAPFVVKDGHLIPADDEATIANPSFEEAKRTDIPAAWNVDDPGVKSFLDSQVKYEGATSLRVENLRGTNGRLVQTFAVKPFRYYNLSFMVKTQDFGHPNSFTVYLEGSQGLAFPQVPIEPTKDWTRIDVPFNTLESTQVILRMGSWGGTSGKFWIDDLKLAPGGFVNLVRREGLPFSVTSADHKTTYVEGKDLPVITDPKLGRIDWPGHFKEWYEQPEVRIPAGSRLKEGDRVLASYSHAVIVLGYGVQGCMCEPKVWPIIKRNLHELHTVIEPDGYILTHDEIRHQGWDETCKKTGKTAAQVLADHFTTCVAMVKAEDPGKTVFAWNDMFDPYMNAAKTGAPYYLVKGIDPWYGAWKCLDKDIVILNWHCAADEHRKDSLKHFADLGMKQVLCGFYDQSSDDMVPWMAEAAKLPGISGVMYTTWSDNFGELDKFIRVTTPKAP